MSVVKRFLSVEKNWNAVTKAYLAKEKPTVVELASQFKTTHATISHILKQQLSPEQLKAEQKLRYSRSKMGSNNPTSGKTGKKHHNWKGECSDCKGYLTEVREGLRYFKHRIVMADALHIPVQLLPDRMHVHHIDGNPLNNDLNNLALVTSTGHGALHSSRLSKQPLWVQYISGTWK